MAEPLFLASGTRHYAPEKPIARKATVQVGGRLLPFWWAELREVNP